jgi:hypothetical protein
VIIETTHSIYEVREAEHRFRRIHGFGAADADLPVGRWFQFQRMSTPTIGEPVQFYWIKGQVGRVSRIGLCQTSPVVLVLPDDQSSGDASAAKTGARAQPRG